jgi:hypothetical protein
MAASMPTLCRLRRWSVFRVRTGRGGRLKIIYEKWMKTDR